MKRCMVKDKTGSRVIACWVDDVGCCVVGLFVCLCVASLCLSSFVVEITASISSVCGKEMGAEVEVQIIEISREIDV